MIQISEASPRIEEALFPVEERPIGIAKGLTTGDPASYEATDKYRAIVDTERDHLFSIVTRDYRLITNREAIDLGRQCFRQVFDLKTDEDMTFFNLVMPGTRSFCHLDFMHQRASEELRPEWVPFLRVTNSYNRTKPLRFDVGFCRWICQNGMIFGQKSIEFRYLHTRREVGRTVVFKTSFRSLQELKQQFDGWIEVLKRVPVQKEQVPPLVCMALGISLQADRWRAPASSARLEKFVRHVRGLDHGYAEQLGRNAYAAFNVMTDVASRPTLGIGPQSAVDGLQRRAAAWAADFARVAVGEAFSVESYLEPVLSQARALPAFAEGGP